MDRKINSIEDAVSAIVRFRDERDWKQFNNPKDLAISLCLEAAEVLEHFQFKSQQEVDDHIVNKKSEIGEELSDVLYWLLLMTHDLEINILEVFEDKLKKTEKKYPVEKSKGNHKKYTEL